MGLKRKGGDRKSAGKVLKIDVWGKRKDTGVFNKGRNAEGNVEKQSGEKVGFRRKIKYGKGKQISAHM